MANLLIQQVNNTSAQDNKEVGKVIKRLVCTNTFPQKYDCPLAQDTEHCDKIMFPTFNNYTGDTSIGAREDPTRCTAWSKIDVSHQHSGESHGLIIRESPPAPEANNVGDKIVSAATELKCGNNTNKLGILVNDLGGPVMRRYPGKCYNWYGMFLVSCPQFGKYVMAMRRMTIIDRTPVIMALRRPPVPSVELQRKVKEKFTSLEDCFTKHANSLIKQ